MICVARIVVKKGHAHDDLDAFQSVAFWTEKHVILGEKCEQSVSPLCPRSISWKAVWERKANPRVSTEIFNLLFRSHWALPIGTGK